MSGIINASANVRNWWKADQKRLDEDGKKADDLVRRPEGAEVIRLALTSLLFVTPLAAEDAQPTPTVTIGDPTTLSGLISFPRPPASKGYGSSEILWRADIHLPKRLSIVRAYMTGYAPIFLAAKDGRCFKLDFNGAGQRLTKVDLLPAICRPTSSVDAFRATAPPAPRAGLAFAGRAWNLIAWTDNRSGNTMFVQEGDRDARPVITTSIRLIAIGAMGSPDAPLTEMSLVGYVHGQLVASTVMLTLP
jgi:hypothetical protein